jgi:hypothetical protein
MAKAAEVAGITLAVKPHVGAAIYSTETALRAIREIDSPDFGINWDPSHLFRNNEDLLISAQRLAPYSYAIAAEVRIADGEELATGRLVLLHDPDGVEAWDGVLRLVAFASAELDPQMGVDPMLPAVGWSWLTGALDERAAAYRAAGGTVTQTTSTRFGDLAGPRTTIELELRASWTADDPDLAPHLHAFVDLLCAAAGLPPEGVTVLSPG